MHRSVHISEADLCILIEGVLITLACVGGGYSSLCVCVTTKLVFKLNYLKI